jgi:hypothetical protein
MREYSHLGYPAYADIAFRRDMYDSTYNTTVLWLKFFLNATACA